MPEKLEQLIRMIYRKWKAHRPQARQPHPDEETLVCFSEGKLSQEENDTIKTHLINCDNCAEAFATQLRLEPASLKRIPKELVECAKNAVPPQDKSSIAEIILQLKDKAIEILNTTGDVLVSQEFVPAGVLRSRQIKEFKDEVTIVKDFKDIRVEVKIENKRGQAFDLIVFIKDKQSHRIIKDLRVTLLKDDLELESYLSTSDKVAFEHVLAGKYVVEISNIENKIASILLDIKR